MTVIVLSLSTLVISVDNTILNVALPTITRTIGATASQIQWIVDAYALVFACLLLAAGALGDWFGRRLMLLIGLTWFAAMAIYSSLGNSPTDLIIGRALMGLGAAFIFPSTLSILTTTFTDPAERGKAIGIWSSVSSLSMVVGPLSGGLLVDHFGWHSVFLVNVPFCMVAIYGTIRWVPAGGRDADRRLDPLGALLSMVAVGALLLAIIEGPEWGWISTGVIVSIRVSVVFVAAFLRWERRTPAPMLDVAIFRNPAFSSASMAVMLAFFASAAALCRGRLGGERHHATDRWRARRGDHRIDRLDDVSPELPCPHRLTRRSVGRGTRVGRSSGDRRRKSPGGCGNRLETGGQRGVHSRGEVRVLDVGRGAGDHRDLRPA